MELEVLICLVRVNGKKLGIVSICLLYTSVSHDDGVVVTGRNTGAELLAVMGLKVLFGGD